MKNNPYIAAQFRADQALLDRYRASLRIINGVECEVDPHGEEVIRDSSRGGANWRVAE